MKKGPSSKFTLLNEERSNIKLNRKNSGTHSECRCFYIFQKLYVSKHTTAAIAVILHSIFAA